MKKHLKGIFGRDGEEMALEIRHMLMAMFIIGLAVETACLSLINTIVSALEGLSYGHWVMVFFLSLVGVAISCVIFIASKRRLVKILSDWDESRKAAAKNRGWM